MRRPIFALLLAVTASAVPAAAQEGPRFSPPVSCLESGRCFIQNYVDLDPGPGYEDYRCGHLTYNGHKGTDFALRDLKDMRDGEPVLAAAPGKVLRVRDGEPDGAYSRKHPDAVKNKECGNGAIIAHGNGWIGKYCHMRQGSVMVKPGDVVQRGTQIGLIGMSGQAEFPHVHLGLLKNKQVIDPFSGPRFEKRCGGNDRSVWQKSAAEALAYRLTEPIKSGFAARKEDLVPAIDGRIDSRVLPRNAPRIIIWSVYKGAKPGDRMVFQVLDPDGNLIGRQVTKPTPRNHARARFGYAVKRKSAEWRPGTYTGITRLVRQTGDEAKTVFTERIPLTIR